MSLKSIVVGVLFLMFFTVTVEAQITYNSADNKQSDWATAATWTRLPASATWAPPSPGNPTNSNTNAINIYGYVRVASGGLVINNANPLVTVYDTLYIVGNVTLGSGASLSVRPAGILIITGNLTLQGSFNMANGGNVVVLGNVNVTNGSITNNSDKFYVFGPTTTSGGGTVDGCKSSSGCTPSSQVQTPAQLHTQNPALESFIANNGVMPVKLLLFKAGLENDQVKLTWTTSAEENFSHFEVEVATEALQFVTIGKVNGAGYTTDDVQQYSFIHTNPVNGVNYYRLKAVDIDGTYEHFNVVSVIVTSSKSVYVYANPSNGQFINVAANFSPGENTRVMIYRADGTLISQNNIADRDVRIDFANQLASGVYLAKYVTTGYSQTVRFVVK